MNVFLMYPDRDLDPEPELPFNETDLTQDLELNILFETMAQGDKFILKAVKQTIFTGLDHPDTIRYRQEILQDCLNHPDILRQMYQIPILSKKNKQTHWMGIFTHYPSGILSGAREMLIMFFGLLSNLKQIADDYVDQFRSRGFRRFFKMIQQELDDDYFALVEQHLQELKFRRGVFLSAELGMGNEGKNYVLRKPNPDDQNWFMRLISRSSPYHSYTLPPRDDHGARALEDLRNRGLNEAANAVAQSADHIDNFFKTLQFELAFYIGCINLYERLIEIGEPIAFPQPAKIGERLLSFQGLYDVSLALTMEQKVVGNDLYAENKDLIVITGANQGGKSTFLRSLGLAKLMMKSGMFVPAESFSANIGHQIFTHYRREEDKTMSSGKFEEELTRMSEIVDYITPNSMVLFNESFAATNEREGSQIAMQIIRALLEKRIQVFFVTHLYELASELYHMEQEKTIFLRAERKTGGIRTYKLIEGSPLETSFGVDVYNKIFGKDQIHDRIDDDREKIYNRFER